MSTTCMELMSKTALVGSTASMCPQSISSESSVRGDEGKHKRVIWDYPQLSRVMCIFNTASSFRGEWE